jgi:hypothetical protein
VRKLPIENSPQVNEDTFWIRLRVGEPFGADHLIAVVSVQTLYGLEANPPRDASTLFAAAERCAKPKQATAVNAWPLFSQMKKQDPVSIVVVADCSSDESS